MTWCQGNNTGLGFGGAESSSWGCHQLAAGLGEPHPVSGFGLPSEEEGLGRRQVSLPARNSMAPTAPRLLVGDPVLTAGIPDFSSRALAFGCPVSLFLRTQCPVFWSQPISEAHVWILRSLCYGGPLAGGVFLASSLSGMTKALSLFEAFQASASS